MGTQNEPTEEDLLKFTLADLYDFKSGVVRQMKEQLEVLNDQLQAVTRVISARLKLPVELAYDRQDKYHGKIRVPLADGFEAVGDISKSVSWDQDKLKALAATMDWPTIQHFFKITFSVSETIFKGLPPGDPRKQPMTDARTVKYGDPKISLEKKSD